MNLALTPEDSAILLIDWQVRLAGAMPAEITARNQKNAANVLSTAGLLGLPVVVTEQYPRGLGHTVEPLAALFDGPAHPKTVFSAMGDTAAAAAIKASGRRTWIVLGMEAHVCVYQTVRALVADGLTAHVPLDAVLSRSKANWHNGLELIRAAGGVVTNTETVLFDLLGEAKGDAFKAVSRMIR